MSLFFSLKTPRKIPFFFLNRSKGRHPISCWIKECSCNYFMYISACPITIFFWPPSAPKSSIATDPCLSSVFCRGDLSPCPACMTIIFFCLEFSPPCRFFAQSFCTTGFSLPDPAFWRAVETSIRDVSPPLTPLLGMTCTVFRSAFPFFFQTRPSFKLSSSPRDSFYIGILPFFLLDKTSLSTVLSSFFT